jgi:chromosome segregation ATPase
VIDPMSDIVERRGTVDPDGLGSVERTADEAGLVSRVSAASFQVSKATEGLEQVAGLLRTAEEFAKNADTERREAEEALELVETQRAELSEMLALARSEAAAAEQRAVAAEERLKALERTFALEARLDDGPRAEPVAGGPRQLTELRRRLMTSIMGLTLAMKHADPSSTNGATMIEQVGASARRLERLLVQLIELDGIADGSFVPNQRRVVADATAVGSAADRTVTEELRELSSFDDLSDEVAT